MRELHFQSEPSTATHLPRLLAPRAKLTSMPAFPDFTAVLDDAWPGAARLADYREALGIGWSDQLPLLYPHVMAGRLHLAMLADQEFPLSMLGAVHTRTYVRRYADLPSTGTYGLRCWFQDIRPVKRGLEFAIATHLQREGEVVWASRNTYLVNGRFAEPLPTPADAAFDDPVDPQTTLRWPLPAGLGSTYAGISGDWNPIHIAPVSAKLFGFKRNIVHGYANLAIALERIGVPEGPVAMDASFKGPVFLDSVAWATHDDQGRFQVFSEADSRPAVVGRWTAGVPEALFPNPR